MATGSYEGSLTMEGTPGHREASPFTRWSGSRPWRLLPSSRPARKGNGASGSHARRRVSVRWKRERRQECQRLDRIVHRGNKTPTLTTRMPRKWRRTWETCSMTVRRSGHGRRETSDPRESSLRSQRLHGGSTQRKLRQEPGTREVRVHAIVRVAEVDRTHRASWEPGGRETSWRTGALAGRKPEAPPDAGHGWRKGETVRGAHALSTRIAWVTVLGFRLEGSRYDGRRSRALARLTFTGGAKRSPRLSGQPPHHHPRGA